MQASFKPVLWGILCLISFVSCSDDDDYALGPEYEINDFEVSVYESDYYNDTIPADIFKLKLTYLSDNDYAFDYGLSPQLVSEITDLKVELTEGNIAEEIQSPMDVSDYFLVRDSEYSYSTGLYQTIEQYITNQDINTLTPYLIFTNQTSLSASAGELITDTVSVTIKISLTLDDTSTISKQLSTVIRP